MVKQSSEKMSSVFVHKIAKLGFVNITASPPTAGDRGPSKFFGKTSLMAEHGCISLSEYFTFCPHAATYMSQVTKIHTEKYENPHSLHWCRAELALALNNAN